MKHTEVDGTPLFSTLSMILAFAAMLTLIAVLGVKGGAVFSPGQLSARNPRGQVLGGASSHADIENQCSRCHQPLVSSQAETCMQCHTDIASQVQQASGLHGLLDNAGACRVCHSDHNGRDFDMIATALSAFDHSRTLFPLSGRHLELACQDCHTQQTYVISPQCSSCHAEPDVHAGLFAQDCIACHTTQAWRPAQWQAALFDHEQTAFSLALHARDYQGSPLTCTGCHQSGSMAVDFQACKTCHDNHQPGFSAAHTAQFGETCTACHDGRDRMANFDHAAFFPLDGAHTALECQSCHADQSFAGTPVECSGCHAEPAIHAGAFGLNCAACHTTQAWQPALLKSHTFPLDHGGQGEIACTTCHIQTYTQYTCEKCHDSRAPEFIREHAKENIGADRLQDCVACHANGERND